MRPSTRLVALVVLAFAGCARGSAQPDAATRAAIADGRQARDELHERLGALVDRDPLLAEALASPGDVLVGIRSDLVEDLVQEVAERYLDRVELDLALDVDVRERGEVTVGTFLGRVKAGAWDLDLVVHRIRGVLRAGSPRLKVAGANRLQIQLPVALEKAEGSATVHFSWDARSVASVVCRDFDVTRTIKGSVLAQEYPVSGSFHLSAGPRTLLAEPAFPPRSFRVRVDLSAESWGEVRRALEEQDKLLKCGMAIDPDEILPKLRELLLAGFDLKLPRSLFRPVELPASVEQSVAVQGREVDLSVKTSDLRITPRAVWYSASVRSRINEGRDRTGGGAPDKGQSGRTAPRP